MRELKLRKSNLPYITQWGWQSWGSHLCLFLPTPRQPAVRICTRGPAGTTSGVALSAGLDWDRGPLSGCRWNYTHIAWLTMMCACKKCAPVSSESLHFTLKTQLLLVHTGMHTETTWKFERTCKIQEVGRPHCPPKSFVMLWVVKTLS